MSQRVIPASFTFCAAALLLLPATAVSQTASTYVSSYANIFGAGHPSNPTPSPGGGSGGVAAPWFSLSSGTGRVLTFSSVTGTSSLSTGVSTTPDGLQVSTGTAAFGLSTDISSYQGVSGIRLVKGSGFLVGVFLSALEPVDPAPSRLEFTNEGTLGFISTAFTSLSPLSNQVFFIGDALTGNGSGTSQTFYIPDDATRLVLGFADAPGYSGLAGAYQDNGNGLLVSFSADTIATPEPTSLVFFATGLVALGGLVRRRRSA